MAKPLVYMLPLVGDYITTLELRRFSDKFVQAQTGLSKRTLLLLKYIGNSNSKMSARED